MLCCKLVDISNSSMEMKKLFEGLHKINGDRSKKCPWFDDECKEIKKSQKQTYFSQRKIYYKTLKLKRKMNYNYRKAEIVKLKSSSPKHF